MRRCRVWFSALRFEAVVLIVTGFSILALSITTNAAAEPARLTLPAGIETSHGPIAYWDFHEGNGLFAHDVSGHGLDGSLMNGATWTTGVKGGALELDGTDDYVVVPDTAALDITSQAMTFMAWIYSPAFHELGWVVGKGWPGWWLLARSNGMVRYGVNAGSGVTEIEYNAGLVTDTWQHVAVVYDGSWMRFYVDGIARDSVPKTGSINPNNAPLYIGLDGFNPSNHFYGKIDEVKIFRRALSPEELLAESHPSCACPCEQDPECDGVISDILDVTRTINVAFRGQASSQDPFCQAEQSDVDGSGATDVIDVTKVINVAFRGMSASSQYDLDLCTPGDQ